MLAAKKSIGKAVAMTLFISGTLDIADALVFYGWRYRVPPASLLQNTTSHLVGPRAFSGGLPMALLGLVLHYFIAACWITAFVLVAQRVRLLVKLPLLCGGLYGLLIYAAMNYLVLPHTPYPSQPTHSPISLLNGILALVIFMGILVALLNRRYAPAV
jgi:uncharacterized membrane protein YagU involved in acid resistance